MDTHLNFTFKQALHFSTLAINFLTVAQNYNCFRNSINQPQGGHSQLNTHTYPHESDLKKPGASTGRLAPGLETFYK